MKHRFFVTFLLLLFLLPFLSLAQPMKIAIPKGWTKEKAKIGQEDVMLYIHPSHEAYIRLRSISIEQDLDIQSMKKIYEMKELKALKYKYKELAYKQANQEKKNPILLVSYEAVVDGMPVRIISKLVKKGDKLHCATGAVKERFFREYGETLGKAIESFQQ